MEAAKPCIPRLARAGAFNMTTGPVHWELLQRARAVDNQLFVAACSPARSPDASYQAWGHSTVVSPWGQVCAPLNIWCSAASRAHWGHVGQMGTTLGSRSMRAD